MFMQDYNYHLFITANFPSIVFVKSRKTKFYTEKEFKSV